MNKPTSEDIVGLLKKVNWPEFWRNVAERSKAEIEGYHAMNRAYLKIAHQKVLK